MQHTPCTPPIHARLQSFVTPSHGMLPPAALANVRSCWTKRASCTAIGAPGAAGVSAWFRKRACSSQERRACSPPWLVRDTDAAPSGVRQPAVVRGTDAAPQNRASFRDRRTHVYRSGGCQPAVAVGNTFAQIQARLFAEPPTVYVRVAVAFAVIVTTGGLRPPLLCCGAHACRRKSDFCDAHTHIRSRAAFVSPPWFVIPTLHRKIEHRSATDERTFTGAAFVSPPWMWETRLRRYKRDCSPNRRRCMCGSPLHSR
jgi:hypothetical protein